MVEKILGVGEELPPSWPVDGTTGYEALRELRGCSSTRTAPASSTSCLPSTPAASGPCTRPSTTARLEVARTILSAEVRRIAATAARAWTDVPGTRSTHDPREAVAELLCGFPVYRSYLPEGRAALDTAAPWRARTGPTSADLLDAIRAACSPSRTASWPPASSRRRAW